MTPNQILLRNLLGVVVAIALITTVALWLGGASRHAARASPRATPPPTHTPLELGARLFETKGCVQCHTIDGTPKVGPSFKGSWGSNVVLADGVTLRFDEAYVRESLARPHAKARRGYPAVMASYDGLLKQHEVDALVEFLRSL